MNKIIFIVVLFIVILISIYIFTYYTSRQPANNEVLKLVLKEEKEIFKKLKIKYVSYEHENTAFHPNEAFAATVAVYHLQLTEGDTTEMVSISQEIENDSEVVEWENYRMQVVKSDTQQQITVLLSKIVK